MSNFYTKLAQYYDHIYSFKDYRTEVQKLLEIIRQYKTSSGNALLDVACGTGGHIEFFREYFETTGVDLNDEMLQMARKRFPDVEFIKSDMTCMELQKQFDGITCLFGSINYLLSDADLKKAISSFSEHTKPGGVLIIEPMFSKESFHSGSIGISCIDLPEFKLSRVNAVTHDRDIAYLNLHFLLATPENVEHFYDPSPMKIIEKDLIQRIMKDQGYEVE